MITHRPIFLLITSLISVQCATFENVTLFLTSRWTKLYVNGKPATNTIFIASSHNLADYLNLQPLEMVKIEHQNVPRLEADSVSNMPHMMEITIASCGLAHIEPGSFRNLPKLDYLNLSHNLLEEIKDGVFNRLNLISLFLQSNRISVLGERAFNNMTLRHLILDDNRISTWKSDWFRGTSLGSIYFSNNSLEELPANSFDYYVELRRGDYHVSLQNLILDNNRLRRIHEDAFKGLEEIVYLSLKNNAIEELPSEVFRTVRHIRTLELSDNKLSNVDAALRNTVIMYLRLHNNNLSCFPVEVFNVTKIHHLSMDGNPVTCDCVKIFENWQQESDERIVYLDKARRTCKV